MKITTKTTKQELKNFLGANAKAVKSKDKELFDQIAYADKMAKKDDSKVTRKDLADLVKSVITLLGDACVEPTLTPVAENSVKKAPLKSKKTPAETPVEEKTPAKEEKQEETKQESAEKPAEKPKKKGGVPKTKPKKESVKPVEGTDNNPKIPPLAEMFPEVLEVGDSKYEIARDIKNMDDLYEAFSKEENIVLAFYWSKRHLKQFPYGDGSFIKAPASFDQDLDVTSCIYVSDEKVVSYHLSMYTEALYQVMPDSIPEFDGCRYSGGIEFQIYREAK